jgi:two-component system response regulator AtoC
MLRLEKLPVKNENPLTRSAVLVYYMELAGGRTAPTDAATDDRSADLAQLISHIIVRLSSSKKTAYPEEFIVSVTILVVDDMKESREFLEFAFRGAGFDVLSASNGEEALETLHSHPVDLVISDILMPVMDGFQLCINVKQDEDLKNIPFVFLTATYKDPQDESFALRLGARRFIRKPIAAGELIDIVRALVSQNQDTDVSRGLQIKKHGTFELKLYNERLVRKLEKKMGELEDEILRRRQVEKELRDSNEAFSAVLDATDDGAILVDQQGTLLALNRTMARRFQKTVPELKGKCFFDLLRSRLKLRIKALHTEVLRTGRGARFEQEWGKRIVVTHLYPVLNPDGAAARVAGFFRDVTDEKLAKEARRESENRFRVIFETTRDCVFIKDRSLRYSHVNPAMADLLGVAALEMIGKTYEDLFGSEPGEDSKENYERVLKGETIEEEMTRTIRGQTFTFLQITSPIRDDQGKIVGICGIARDITGRKPTDPVRVTAEVKYESASMKAAQKASHLAAQTDSIVLLTGESGSGKDFMAYAIHEQSKRSRGPFFSINCAAVPPELAESELFGHERGAYTGSIARSRGLLELAEGGTLLLNEIGELPLSLQAKLLSFLDTRSYTRVGGRNPITVSARLIAATNRDLEEEVNQHRFRADLFYRLNVLSINIPPLRERIEDIPVLVEQILSKLAADLRRPIPRIRPETMERLIAYNWPGNVRELKNVLERALILSEDSFLEIGQLKPRPNEEKDWSYTIGFPEKLRMPELLKDLRRQLVEEALRRSGGNKQEAARLLGISRHTLWREMDDSGSHNAD